MNKTTIEWTDYTWNPVTGCTKVSAVCKHCYAETMANRFWGDRKFTDVHVHEDRLNEPAKNKKKWAGKKVFVCSMSDLFHEDVPYSFIMEVLSTINQTPDTVFQILTKRPARALEIYNRLDHSLSMVQTFSRLGVLPPFPYNSVRFPPPNLWIGTSCEDQATANERIPLLLQIPAAARFLSCEPLLGPIDLTEFLPSPGGEGPGVRWVIAGGESGHGARPMHPAWARSLRDQCASANVPFFFKQWGEWLPSPAGEGPGVRLGKSKAGNLLDGLQHLEFPNLQIKTT
jgi:protein gp37